MRIAFATFLAVIVTAITVVSWAQTQSPANTAGAHKIFMPQDIAWQAVPPSLPSGAEMTVLYGDPAVEGPFAMRLRVPAGYHIPPHTHPQDEVVTVLSGTFRLGMGETAAHKEAQALPAGSFFAMPPGMTHYAYADEETVVQLNGIGPWEIRYVNPADDPRM